MPDDETFRRVLLAGIAVILPVAAFYRIRSQLTGEKLDRRQEGWFLAVRPLGLLLLGATVAFLIDPAWMAWSSVPLPDWLRWCGVGALGLSFVLLAWTFHSLGRNLTDTVVTRKNATLVTHGPYRWVRHPFYTSFLMSIVAVGLVTANWFIALAGLLPWWLLVLRTRIEEQKLIERFGDEYRRYMETTGRFWPRLSNHTHVD